MKYLCPLHPLSPFSYIASLHLCMGLYDMVNGCSRSDIAPSSCWPHRRYSSPASTAVYCQPSSLSWRSPALGLTPPAGCLPLILLMILRHDANNMPYSSKICLHVVGTSADLWSDFFLLKSDQASTENMCCQAWCLWLIAMMFVMWSKQWPPFVSLKSTWSEDVSWPENKDKVHR